jgi:WD40 repeat protein
LKHPNYWFFDTTVWFTADDQSLVLLTHEDKAHWYEPGPHRAVVVRWKWTDPRAWPEKVAVCLGVPKYHVAVSPDNRWLVSSRSWTEQHNLNTVETHNGGLHRNRSSRAVEVWNLATGEKGPTFDAGAEVAQLGFDRDGSLWTLGTTEANDGYVPRRWEVPSGKLLHEIPVRLDGAGLTISPDGRTLARMAFMEDRIRRWDVQTGRSLDPLPDPIPWSGAQFAPDGAELWERRFDGTEHRWDAKTGRYLGTRTRAAIPTPEWGRVWPSESGLTVTTAFDPVKKEHAVAVWDSATCQKLMDLPAHPPGKIQSVIVTPDRTWVLVWCAVDEKTCSLRRWNLTPLQLAWDVRLPIPQRPEVSISHDGKSVYLGDWHIRAFDAETGRERFTRKLFDAVPKDWLGQASWGRNVCWLADGRIVRSFPKHGLAIAHPETGEFRLIEMADAQALSASPDGKRLAVAGRTEDAMIRVYDTEQWTEIWSGRLSPREVSAVRFSPDGRRLFVLSQWPIGQAEVFDLP